ncbi:hypothetical protein ENBRE01_0040 [Enteropsectra breve]|nr:hypothetical protein ENBRE01_0040 [Enteropsectra breve]
MRTYTTFKHPYILVEDAKAKMRPIFREYAKTTPKINTDSQQFVSPFYHANMTKKVQKKPQNNKAYCDICHTNYMDYETHVNGVFHREYTSNPSNYKIIDAFICRFKNEHRNSESMRLLNSPCDVLERGIKKLMNTWGSMKENSSSILRISQESSIEQNQLFSVDEILENIDLKM